jgi:8-oxo-dGTP diphosphatase
MPRTIPTTVQLATLCYPVENDRVLLIEKKRGVGAGLYNGPGGKVEPGESPRQAVVREVREETGLRVFDPEMLGELAFYFGDDPFMDVHVFRATDFAGEPTETPEARPEWFALGAVPYDEMWPDDRYWLPELFDGETFAGTMYFDSKGDELLDWELDFGVTVE